MEQAAPEKTRVTIYLVLFSIAVIVYWLLVLGWEHAYLAKLQPPPRSIDTHLLLLLLNLSPIALIALLISFTIKGHRLKRLPVHLLLCAAIAFLMYYSSSTHFSRRDAAWSSAFHNLDSQSRPLIAAIKDYQHNHHGAPPESLDDLVPRYLTAIPSTGITAFPNYHYFAHDNTWTLRVQCPRGSFVDLSCYEYMWPERGEYVGNPEIVERNGGWVYIRD